MNTPPNEVEELEQMLKDASNDIDQILVQTVFKPLTAKTSKQKADAIWGITSEVAILARQRIRNELGVALQTYVTNQNQAYHAAGLRELEKKAVEIWDEEDECNYVVVLVGDIKEAAAKEESR